MTWKRRQKELEMVTLLNAYVRNAKGEHVFFNKVKSLKYIRGEEPFIYVEGIDSRYEDQHGTPDLTVSPGTDGLDVKILGILLKTKPSAVSVAFEKDAGKNYTLFVCSYPNEVKIGENLELELRKALPNWYDFEPGLKGRLEGKNVRVLMIDNKTNVREVYRDRRDIIPNQKLLVGKPRIVDRLQRALTGDSTALI